MRACVRPCDKKKKSSFLAGGVANFRLVSREKTNVSFGEERARVDFLPNFFISLLN